MLMGLESEESHLCSWCLLLWAREGEGEGEEERKMHDSCSTLMHDALQFWR